MKTKNLTINLSARKFNAVYETAAFEALVSVIRMANAYCIAIEAADSHVEKFGGRPLKQKDLRSILRVLVRLGHKGECLLKNLCLTFRDTPSFAGFERLSIEEQDRLGTAPLLPHLLDIKITSQYERVSSALRALDLVGERLLLAKKEPGNFELCEAELSTRETLAFCDQEAARQNSNVVYELAINQFYSWAFQFNHAALSFIRGQAKDLGLTLLEEEELGVKVPKGATVH